MKTLRIADRHSTSHPTRFSSCKIMTVDLDLPPLSEEQKDKWSNALLEDDMLIFPGDVVESLMTEITNPVIPSFIDPIIIESAQAALEQCLGLPIKPQKVTFASCLGTDLHHDGHVNVFCVVWLGNEPDLEFFTEDLNVKIPLKFGTCIIFDALMRHGVKHAKDDYFQGSSLQDYEVANFISFDMEIQDYPQILDPMEITLIKEFV